MADHTQGRLIDSNNVLGHSYLDSLYLGELETSGPNTDVGVVQNENLIAISIDALRLFLALGNDFVWLAALQKYFNIACVEVYANYLFVVHASKELAPKLADKS